jgi:hypothetical protein
MNTDVQKSTDHKMPIPAWYMEAFALRMMGYTYQEIARKTQKSDSHIRNLFAKSGKLYGYWRDYVEEHKSHNIEEALDMAFAHLPNAMRAHIIASQNVKSSVGLEARRDLFAYTLGKPDQRVKLDAKVGIFNFGDWAMAQAESIKTKNAEQPEVQPTGESSTTLPA